MPTNSLSSNSIEELEIIIQDCKENISYYNNHLTNPSLAMSVSTRNRLKREKKEYEFRLKEALAAMSIRKHTKYYNIPLAELYRNSWTQNEGTSKHAEVFERDLIGIEIELEGERLQCSPMNYWKQNTEQSLRMYNGQPPVEFVLSKPLDRPSLGKALDYLGAKMKSFDSNPVVSPRTSVHVHLNARDLTWKKVITWAVCYFILEELLVEYSGKQRVGNLFCLRTKDTAWFLSTMEAALKQENYTYLVNPDFRYTSLNLASLTKFGSLEFRSMRAPIPFETIELWTDILLSIKNASLEFESPAAVIEFFEANGPQVLLRRLLPNSEHHSLFYNHQGLHQQMWDAVRNVKDVAYAVEWEEPKIDLKIEKSRKDEDQPVTWDNVGWPHTANPFDSNF